MEYNVGDLVKIVKREVGNNTGAMPGWDQPNGNVGSVGKVSLADFSYQHPYRVNGAGGEYYGLFSSKELSPCCSHGKAEEETCVECLRIGDSPENSSFLLKVFLNAAYNDLPTITSGWTQSLPKKGTFMRKLSELSQKVRRAFSAEQKALWRVGYIDECGNWTAKATDYVDTLVADEHKTQLVESAQEILDLAKEEKKEEEE